MRTDAGLTQEALARKLRTTNCTVSRWELGTHEPSIEVLERIAKACGFYVELLAKEKTK